MHIMQAVHKHTEPERQKHKTKNVKDIDLTNTLYTLNMLLKYIQIPECIFIIIFQFVLLCCFTKKKLKTYYIKSAIASWNPE